MNTSFPLVARERPFFRVSEKFFCFFYCRLQVTVHNRDNTVHHGRYFLMVIPIHIIEHEGFALLAVMAASAS